MAALGVLVIAAWAVTRDDSTMSMLLFIAGISTICLAIMLYFFSPSRYLRSDVCDAMSQSNALNIGNILASLMVESKGVYVPAGDTGFMRVFIPLSSSIGADELSSVGIGNEVFKVSGQGTRGIYLIPPGYGLFRYSRSIGAAFTQEGLENEIKDVVENGLELASRVTVKRNGDRITVSLGDITDKDMCRAVRNENPAICGQIGCPICSFIGCMVASGTGRKTRIESVSADDKAVTVTYELI